MDAEDAAKGHAPRKCPFRTEWMLWWEDPRDENAVLVAGTLDLLLYSHTTKEYALVGPRASAVLPVTQVPVSKLALARSPFPSPSRHQTRPAHPLASGALGGPRLTGHRIAKRLRPASPRVGH